MRRTLALLLTAVMLLSMLSFGTSAETTYAAKIIKSDTTERGQYTTISDAIKALQDGDTLVLLKDLTENKSIKAQGKNITITAEPGVIITSKLSFETASVASNGNITLKDLTFKNTNCDSSANALAIYQYNNVVIENCTITFGGGSSKKPPIAIMTGYSSDRSKSVSLTIKNSNITVSGYAFAIYARSENKITVEDTVFTTTASSHLIGINLSVSGGYANFVRCKFNVNSSVFAINASTSAVNTSFKDCTFTTTKNKTILSSATGSHLTFDNVTFNIPSTYTASTYVITGAPNMSLLSATFANSSANNVKIANFSSADMSKNVLVYPNSVLEWTVGNDKLAAAAEINSAAVGVSGVESIVSTAITEINKMKSSEAIASRKTVAINDILNGPKTAAEEELKNYLGDVSVESTVGIISSAIEDLWDASTNTVDAVNNIVSKAKYDVKADAEAEIRETASGATDQRILDVLSSAIADVWDEINSTAQAVNEVKNSGVGSIELANSKLSAENELKAVASDATDQRVLDVLSSGITEVWNANSMMPISGIEQNYKTAINLALDKLAAEEELKAVASGATDQRVLDMLSSGIAFIWEADGSNLTSRKNYVTRSLKLTIYKATAETEVKDYSEGSSYPAVVEIVSSATEKIWSTGIATNSAVDKIVADAKVEMDKYKSMIAAEAEIRNYASSATDERILDVISSACAEVWEKTTSSAVKALQDETFAKVDFINVQIAAETAVKAEAADPSETVKEIISGAMADIAAAQDETDVENAKSSAIVAIRAQIAVEALEKAKTDATAAVNAEVTKSSAAVDEIASKAIADINAAETVEAVEDVKSTAIADIRAQLAKEALEEAKTDAVKAVKAEDVKSSAAAAEISSKAIADINAAETVEAVETVKSTAIADIRAQLAKEALEKAIADAKEAAIAEINSEAISSSAAMQTIVSGAIADVNAAKTLEAVETARSAAITAIRAQLVAEAPKTADYTVWFVIVAAVAMLGCAVVTKKKFF